MLVSVQCIYRQAFQFFDDLLNQNLNFFVLYQIWQYQALWFVAEKYFCIIFLSDTIIPLQVYEIAERVDELKKKWPDSWGPFDTNGISIVAPYSDQVS